ncbi:MAG: glycosyltransferase [Bacteroidia bacterium]|nr:glycosyltransferase [Bacteroidia bacterium]
MLPLYDVFMFGLTRSDYPLSSVSVAWAKEWAKTNRVFYIDRPFSLKDIRKEWHTPKFKKRLNALFLGKDTYKTIAVEQGDFVQVTPLLSLPVNFLPQGKLYNWLNQYNQYVMHRAIKKIIKDYQVKNYVYFNSFHPVICPFIPKQIQPYPLASIYQSLDEISEEPYIARHGILAENAAMQNCDIAIGTSTKLCERHEQTSHRKVHLLANAADYELFENALNKPLVKPDEFTRFTKPVIIYTGHYSDLRLDHELVKKITAAFTDYEILFVGTYVQEDIERHKLTEIPNLHFIGSRPIEQLPAYLKYSKVAIIPYKSNSLTAGIYPLKINEYLAAGIPCVSSDFSKDIAGFKEVIYLANTHNRFIDCLKQALLENPQERLAQRMQVAASNSWRMRINKLENIVEDFAELNGRIM